MRAWLTKASEQQECRVVFSKALAGKTRMIGTNDESIKKTRHSSGNAYMQVCAVQVRFVIKYRKPPADTDDAHSTLDYSHNDDKLKAHKGYANPN